MLTDLLFNTCSTLIYILINQGIFNYCNQSLTFSTQDSSPFTALTGHILETRVVIGSQSSFGLNFPKNALTFTSDPFSQKNSLMTIEKMSQDASVSYRL